jgi:hypothetical protein
MGDTMKVVVYGAGQMGSRLAQGLLSVDRSRIDVGLEVYFVDPSSQSRETAVTRASEIMERNGTQSRDKVAAFTGVEDLPKHLDLALLSATSKHRYQNLSDLLAHAEPKHLLLEKFLFVRHEHYEQARQHLNNRGISAWVHCPRSYWPAYQDLKAQAGSDRQAFITVSGSSYALASNCVHFFDLCRYFNGRPVDRVVLDPGTVETDDNKRAGYREVFGELTGYSENEPVAKLSCQRSEDMILHVNVAVGVRSTTFDETGGHRIDLDTDGNELRRQPFAPLFASNNPAVFEDILLGKTPLLPTFEEASTTHLAVFEAMMPYIGDESGALPVT